MMFALRQMMTLSLMMFPLEMMSASPNVMGKHHIITKVTSLCEALHHIAGDTSLKDALKFAIIWKRSDFRERK